MELRRKFVEDGTWIVPEGVTKIRIKVRGGEASGPNPGLPQEIDEIIDVVPGDVYPITIGKGGATQFGGRALDGWIEIWW